MTGDNIAFFFEIIDDCLLDFNGSAASFFRAFRFAFEFCLRIALPVCFMRSREAANGSQLAQIPV